MIKVEGTCTSAVDSTSALYKKLQAIHDGLAKKDPLTWGAAASQEAAIRLNWVDLPESSRDLLPVLDALAAKKRGFTRVVLCGMGGSSLGPEVIAKTFKKELFVFDSTDPNYVQHALDGDLSKTLVVVSSKSGSTVETASQRDLFIEAFTQAGLDPVDHLVIVTDPGSPFDKSSRESGFTVINADPNVGGRFSVLGAFGLVPAALIGVDVSLLLDSAHDAKELILRNPSIAIGAAYSIVTCTKQYLAFADDAGGAPGLSDWIEQLVAESTGKSGVGRLPVVLESATSPSSKDSLSIRFAGDGEVVVSGELGAQFIFWEWVTALVGGALEIDPFNQPNVQEAKDQTGALLKEWAGKKPALHPSATDSAISLYGAPSVEVALKEFIAGVKSDGYIGVMAYLDRKSDVKIEELRSLLAAKTERPVTFGWGPRFLHSTGQFHKGGQPNGSFIQITGAVDKDYLIPHQNFGFETLITAQALGDAKALSTRGLSVLHLHLNNRADGIEQLIKTIKAL